MICGGERGFAMKMKNRTGIGRELILIVLAMLFLVSVPTIAVSAAPESGTLTIHKYILENMDDEGIPNDGNEAEVPDNAVQLAGAEFTVWQVNPDVAATVNSASAAHQHIMAETKQTGITDADGEFTFSMAQGLYYVEETDSAGAIACNPFIVSVPMESPVEDGWITDVHVYPKNQLLSIDGFVGDAGNADYDYTDFYRSKYKPVATDAPFGWSILSTIPANLGSVGNKTYIVTDELKDCLDYVQGSLKVYAVPTMETSVKSAYTLIEGSHYTYNFNASTNTLTVELTEAGMALLGNRYSDNGDRFLLIKFDCTLNITAPSGVRIYNGAEVKYTRDFAGVNYMADASVAEEPAVHTGKIGIKKVEEGTNKALAGAEFGLAVSKAEAEAGNFIATGTTDKDGMLEFKGLEYGALGDSPSSNSNQTSFWLVETKAPAGYKMLKSSEEVTFNYQQDKNTGEYYFAQVTVYNAKSGTAATPSPSTTPKTTTTSRTGDSSNLFIYIALLLLSSAAIVVVVRIIRKRRAGGKG